MSALSRLVLQNGTYLVAQKEIVAQVGMLGAIILQQIHYFSTLDNPGLGKIHEGRKWIYNSYKAWTLHLSSYSETTIYRTIRKLEKLKLLLSKTLHAFKGNRTKWYAINYAVLESLFGKEKSLETLTCQNDEMVSSKRPDHNKDTKTTSEKGLNSACARETFQPLIEEEEKGLAQQGVEQAKNFIDSVSNQALTILNETITPALDKPLDIQPHLFSKALTKLMKSHFRTIDNWRAYCTKVAANLFLTAKKPMKSGDTFKLSAGILLSKKTIEDSWEDKGFFNVYPHQDSKQIRKQNEPPELTIEDVLAKSISPLDCIVKSRVFEQIGWKKYLSWFHTKDFEITGVSGRRFEFKVKNEFCRDRILAEFAGALNNAGASVIP